MIFYYILFAAVFIGLLYYKLTNNTRKGSRLEKHIERIFKGLLKSKILTDTGSFAFRDIMLGEVDKTSQIDNVLYTPYGVFVIEAKNYKGFIFGSDHQLNWTVTTQSKNKRINKYRFYNPVKQNMTHINALKKITGALPYYNMVVFGNGANLKKLELQEMSIVLNVNHVKRYLLNTFKDKKTIINKHKLTEFQTLLNEKNITEKKLRAGHVKRIKKTYKK